MYGIALSDARRMVESVVNEEKARDSQYLREVEDTILASPAIASRDSGFYGYENRRPPRQLGAARRFAGFFDLLMGILRDAIKDRELRENDPAYVARLQDDLRAVEAIRAEWAVAMKVQGSKERGAMRHATPGLEKTCGGDCRPVSRACRDD
jgi:hypothetical protein